MSGGSSRPPAWLFSNNSSISSTVDGPATSSVAMAKATKASKKQKHKQPSSAASTSSSAAGAAPPAPPQLLDLVESFLSVHSFDKAHREFKQQRERNGWQSPVETPPNAHHSLVSVFETWETSLKDTDGATRMQKAVKAVTTVSSSSNDTDSSSEEESEEEAADVDMQDVAAENDTSSSSSSSSDESDSEMEENEVGVPENPSQMKSLKRKAASDSDSSSSDSDSSSDSSSEDERPQLKKQKAADTSSDSDSDSDDSSSDGEEAPAAADDKASTSSSSSSSSSESDSESEAEVDKAAKVPLPDSSSSGSDDSSSDSDSESEETPSQPQRKVVNQTEGSDTSVTMGKTSPEFFPVSKFAPLPPDPDVSLNNRGKIGGAPTKQPNEPFSRIRKDIQVDPRLSSNAFNAHDWGRKAHEDLIVTKGKGFTKEKNKKKKGSYRGGFIDTSARNGIRVE